jgi:hypothetical protein
MMPAFVLIRPFAALEGIKTRLAPQTGLFTPVNAVLTPLTGLSPVPFSPSHPEMELC